MAGLIIAPGAASAVPCPACGPVPAASTSRYCARHLRQLRTSWLAHRQPRPILAGVPSRSDRSQGERVLIPVGAGR